MSKPRISVLIDTYNHERYIEQAIVSVLEQDFPREEMEIVVVDDGSTDNTPSIIKNFLPQLRYIRKNNGGQASAFNAAIPELRGSIVAFLDGDDWWTKQKLSVIAETFEANPKIAAIGHGFYEVHDTAPAREMFVPAKTCLLDLSSVAAARLADAGLALLGTSRLAVRREVLNRIGPLPEDLVFCADSPIVAFALALGGAVILDRPLCYYRQHSQNLFAPIAMDGATERRKFEQLRFLFSYVPPRLAEFGVAPDVIDAFVESPRVEFERAKLYAGEGGRLEVFRTERRRFQTYYQNRNAGYRLFEFAVGACALILPPRNFYQLLHWYGRHNFARLRSAFGKAQPKVPPAFFQRLPVSPSDLQSDQA
jgi:glycosyltransferase involved in cell wall biosynthesis